MQQGHQAVLFLGGIIANRIGRQGVFPQCSEIYHSIALDNSGAYSIFFYCIAQLHIWNCFRCHLCMFRHTAIRDERNRRRKERCYFMFYVQFLNLKGSSEMRCKNTNFSTFAAVPMRFLPILSIYRKSSEQFNPLLKTRSSLIAKLT